MKWVYAAITGFMIGWLTYVVAWAALSNTRFAKDPEEKKSPPWPVVWAMSIAFVVIALSWAGFFREVIPLPAPDEYEQQDQ